VSLNRYAKRHDANHKSIVTGLRKLGYFIVDMAPVGGGVLDLLVYDRLQNPVWIELKTAKGKLRESQTAFIAQLERRGIHHGVARTLDEALTLLGHDVRRTIERNAAAVDAKAEAVLLAFNAGEP
jgi:hypothetical protein